MDDIRTTLLPTFLQEAEGKMPVIESFLQKRVVESCDLAALDNACRAVHTLKGTAGLIKAESVRRIAMRIEDILERHLLRKTSPSIVEYDALNLAQGKMTLLIDCLGSSQPEPQGLIEGVMQALDLVTVFPGQPGSAAESSDKDLVKDPFEEDQGFGLLEPAIEETSAATDPAQALPVDPFAEDHYELSGCEPPDLLKGKMTVDNVMDPFADDPDFEPVTGHHDDSTKASQIINEEAADSQNFTCCCFELSDRTYSIPIENMVEISDLPPVVDLPLSPVHIHGMVNLRGKVLPLVDIGGCDGDPAGPSLNRRMVVVDAQGEEFAFLCDGVPSLEAEFTGSRIDPVEFKTRYSIGAT